MRRSEEVAGRGAARWAGGLEGEEGELTPVGDEELDRLELAEAKREFDRRRGSPWQLNAVGKRVASVS